MFKRKIQCKRCGKKLETGYSYCPFCGSDLKQNKEKENYYREQNGRDEREHAPDNLLDALDGLDNVRMPFMLRFPFKKLVREIEKQFREIDKSFSDENEEMRKMKKMKMSKAQLPFKSFSQGISISIAGSEDGKPVIRVKQFGPGAPGSRIAGPNTSQASQYKEINKEGKEKLKKPKELNKAEKTKLEKFSKLPKQEPETNVRRLSDKIIYEILVPGIKDKRNIIINKLQNSIEIKAFTKDKAYFKLIPLSLPIKRHYLENEKLILELNPQI